MTESTREHARGECESKTPILKLLRTVTYLVARACNEGCRLPLSAGLPRVTLSNQLNELLDSESSLSNQRAKGSLCEFLVVGN